MLYCNIDCLCLFPISNTFSIIGQLFGAGKAPDHTHIYVFMKYLHIIYIYVRLCIVMVYVAFGQSSVVSLSQARYVQLGEDHWATACNSMYRGMV